MKHQTRTAAALAIVMLASGCANTKFRIPFFGNDEDSNAPSYTQSRKALRNRPLEIPPDLSSPSVSGAYGVPGLTDNKLSAEGKKILETGVVLPKFDKVRMESVAGQRWLVINASADTVWPAAREFWLEQGFKLNVDNPTAGLIETDWLEERPDLPIGTIRSALQRGLGTLYSTGRVDQFRMRLERGSEPNTTEIYISHRGMEEVYTDRERTETRWTQRKPEPEREAEQVKKLLVRLGVSNDGASQVLASAAPAAAGEAKPIAGVPASKASLSNQADGKRALVLSEGFDRAWRRVGLALEHAGYGINDRDRSLGIYYVSPAVGKDGKPEASASSGGSSWLSKLAFWKSDEKKPLDLVKGPEYLVIVSAKDGQTQVRVGTREGSNLPQATADAMLDALLGELR
ncbi:outer membrane protein assembly factor BamC [Chitinimonas sp.]|uniref:outer membrane protein assembly factor BamC n=1 Tax=Chitinimonas sp. TaxID=1934313 RepID=UPI0035AFB513